jgi:hypothetical protein
MSTADKTCDYKFIEIEIGRDKDLKHNINH